MTINNTQALADKDLESLQVASPFEKGVVCKGVRETSDGKGVLFFCPSSKREFIVAYDALSHPELHPVLLEGV